nr:L,D-transpeptidase family protein [Caulobacter sp. 17J80-11]
MAEAYRARNWRPIWWDGARPRPAAAALLRVLADAGADGLDPERYGTDELAAVMKAAEAGGPAERARADVRLTRAYADYVVDLHRPRADAALFVADPAAAPAPPTRAAVLADLAKAPDLAGQLAASRRMNPVYEDLRRALQAHRALWSGLPQAGVPTGPTLTQGAEGPRVAALRRRLGLPGHGPYDPVLAEAVREFQASHGLPQTGEADAQTIGALNRGFAHDEQLILANLERARALPADPGRRFLVVDVGAARLALYENGHVADSMRVVVGKPAQPTPALAGMVRYAVFEPYWNVPEDLARTGVAAHVLSEGVGYLERQRMELLSDWSDDAHVIAPSEVDWPAVAAGRRSLRVRQLPGPGNMMGQVKLMFPNPYGVYLHDTPAKELFGKAQRNFSSGCVRLEDAPRLARRLLGPAAPAIASGGVPEQRVDLAEPVPVYILYLTAAPGSWGVEFRPDVYGRDPALVAALARPSAPSVRTAAAPADPQLIQTRR